MGLTHLDAVIANPGNPRRAAKLRLLVDSGAGYSIVPSELIN
jgi:hypothetical protein